MKSLVKYLQKHLDGEVLSGHDILQAFSGHGSLIQRLPQAIIFARDERDVRRLFLFLSQVVARGPKITLTIRGGGSDLNGAAVGEGLILVMPTYFDKLLTSHHYRRRYLLEAGFNIRNLQSLLSQRGSFVPALYNLPPQATIGGAAANNSYSKFSTKYGLLDKYIKALKIVLANGDLIIVKKLSRAQVMKKLALNTFEGDIYRELHRLFYDEDSPFFYKTSPLFHNQLNLPPQVLGGYNLQTLCQPDGSLNLVSLFCGSQGTLGLITEVEVQALPYNDQPQAVLLKCADFARSCQLALNIKALKPASLTMINGECFKLLKSVAPYALADFEQLDQAEVILLLEFDDTSRRRRGRKLKQLASLTQDSTVQYEVMTSLGLENLDRLRTGLSLIVDHNATVARYISSGFSANFMPLEHLATFYLDLQKLCKTYEVPLLAFGELGFGHFSLLPKFDLRTHYHKNRFLKFLDDYLGLVLKHEGRLHVADQEGALLGGFLPQAMDDQYYQLLQTIKDLFDPYNILNAKVKLGATQADILESLQTLTTGQYASQHFKRLC